MIINSIVSICCGHPFLSGTMLVLPLSYICTNPRRAFWVTSFVSLHCCYGCGLLHTCFTHELLHDVRGAVFAGLHCHTRLVSILPKQTDKKPSRLVQLSQKLRHLNYIYSNSHFDCKDCKHTMCL